MLTGIANCHEYKLLGREALKTIYKVDEKTAEKIEKRMIELVKTAVEIYEKRGLHLGDVAADVILTSRIVSLDNLFPSQILFFIK